MEQENEILIGMEMLQAKAIEDIQVSYARRKGSAMDSAGLAQALNWCGKSYKGSEEEQRLKLFSWYDRQERKEIEKVKQQIKTVSDAGELSAPLIITVEWTQSRTWGKNPRAFTNQGFCGQSIGGCGYCKLSTATAQALNSCLPILRLLYLAKDRAIRNDISTHKDLKNDLNRSALGYGSGYGIIPRFEGGVGIESHQRIIEGLNLDWKYITSTSNTDVFMISQ